ncbi:MAG: AAA family ATPase [Alphaproteobacteria bacterium GM202ARS2]|nr:AAA family ATPase [Alphaproteobacteria bacterium GM202ARS2]
MLTQLTIRNFKLFEKVDVPLGNGFVFVGPNNSGKTTALQALALWHIGLTRWLARRSGNGGKKNRGAILNRKDLIDVPIAHMDLIWHDRKVRKATNQNIFIEIVVEGVNQDKTWQCGLEFQYASNETFYCRPLRTDREGNQRMDVPDEAKDVRVFFLPPMSGLASEEPLIQQGRIHVLMGQGQTAEVLRNLCYNVSSQEDKSDWQAITRHMKALFGVDMHEPQYAASRGAIVLEYTDAHRKKPLDLPSSGRGMQQVLLLFAYLYGHPVHGSPKNTVFVLDEPDAHLETLRQNETYKLLNEAAERRGDQIIAASHSEALLESSIRREEAVAFLGVRPRPRILGKGQKAHVIDALKTIGFQYYYLAAQKGWVLYLEGDTDLSILQAFAKKLNHPAEDSLSYPCVKYVGLEAQTARKHFHSLKAAEEDLQGFLLLDHIPSLETAQNLHEHMWQKNEIENYLCHRDALVAYVKADLRDGDMFDESRMKEYERIIEEEVDRLVKLYEAVKKPQPFSDDIKASDDFLVPLFENFVERAGMKETLYRYRKTNFHRLVDYIPKDAIDAEVKDVLDTIHMIDKKAQKTLK